MSKVEIVFYNGHRLAAIAQPAGGWLVEIIPIAGGKPVLTETFRELPDAMASARAIVDNVELS
jgi:hypothetical protein